jgi:GNAT superfamily N-acetyltransferase
MDAHPLDNPVWHALIGPHAGLGVALGPGRRYHPEVAVFAALERLTPEGLAGFAAALPAGATAALVGTESPVLPPELEAVLRAEVLQMHAPAFRPVAATVPIEALGEADVPAMVELVALTEPGPFARRTREMGRYIGIREGGRLAAMAGERLRLGGFTEVSAVCTHPDYRGRGYARMLVSAVGAGILARGDTPFLHVYPHNRPAIRTYEALGFSPRALMQFTVFRRRAA